MAHRTKALRTRMLDMFAKWGVSVPVMSAPMAGVSGGALAAAVAHGGALPFIAAGHASPNSESNLDREIDLFRQQTSTLEPRPPLCLGFITYSSLSRIDSVLTKHKPDVVQFTAPGVAEGAENIKIARRHGIGCVMAQVGSIKEAEDAISAGVDVIIAQGTEAGGHGLRVELGTATLPLAAAVCSMVRSKRTTEDSGPLVLAAGGISDGRGVVAALSLGCDGVSMGTRFFASHQAMGSTQQKQAIVDASADNTIRTRVFDLLNNTASANPWPCPYDSAGALHNTTSRAWHDKPEKLDETLQAQGGGGDVITAYRGADDTSVAAVWMGQGVSDVREIESADAIVRRVHEEACEAIERLQGMLTVSDGQPAK